MSTFLIDRLLQGRTAAESEFQDAAIPVYRQVKPAVDDSQWSNMAREGELAVDVYQTGDAVVIVSVIGGFKPEEIAIEIQNDIVTIRGVRQRAEQVPDDCYLYQECYWGSFSRSIVLPVEVRAEEAQAIFRSGVLRVEVPKAVRLKSTVVQVVEEGEE